MTALIESVRIGDDEIQAVRGPDGEGYAVVRRMCEALGIDDDAQRVKLRCAPWAVALTIKATGPDGKSYDSFCLHVKSVPMWLATIDAGRVSEAARAKLVLYQREAADVLYRWATGQLVAKPQSLEERALALVTELQARVAEQRRQLAEAAPKVESFDRLMGADGTYSLQDVGRILGLGANKLQREMTADGILFLGADNRRRPHAEHVEAGRFVVKTGTHGVEQAHTHVQTRVTPAGLEYLRRFYSDHNIDEERDTNGKTREA